MSALLAFLSIAYGIAGFIEYLAPDAINFEAIVWSGLILIIAWAVVDARARQKGGAECLSQS